MSPTLVIDILLVVLFLVALEYLGYVFESRLMGRGIQWLRRRLARSVPIGYYRVDRVEQLRVGVPDTTIMFKLAVPTADGARRDIFIAVADGSTRFQVRGAPADLDTYLEAYDDELSPFEFEVSEPGKIASAGIGDAEARNTP